MDYKKILEGVVNIINTTEKSDIGFVNICTYIGENCPELKESEDEKIREKVIDVLKLNIRGAESQMQASRGVDRTFEVYACNKVIALLEKQGKLVEINPTEFDTRLQTLIGKFGSLPKEELIGSLSFWMNVVQNDGTYKPAEKQGEKEQDPCEHCNDKLLNCHNFPCIKKKAFEQGKSTLEVINEEKVDNANKVEPKFKVGDWVVHDMSDGRVSPPTQIVDMTNKSYVFDTKECFYFSDAEEVFRKWTIQDANDGDVLSYRDGQWIYLYKEKIDDSSFDYHILYSTIHQDLTTNDSGFTLLSDAIIPATKEQRDTLMKAMADKGYTFDFEKKELNKIEQKPTWSEDDERLFQIIIDILDKEEHKGHLSHTDLIACVRKLKTLRPQTTWKPSEEQIKSLQEVIETGHFTSYPNALETLYEQLKKLKEGKLWI